MAPEGLTQLWPSTLRQPGHEKPADNKSHMERGKVMFETFMGELNVSQTGYLGIEAGMGR